MSRTASNVIHTVPLSYLGQPKLGESHRIKNEVDSIELAELFAKSYGLTIKEVSALQQNLKYTVTYVSYKQ